MNQPLLLYDGYCALCNRVIKFILKHDKQKVFSFATLTGKTAQQLGSTKNLNTTIDSVVLFYNNQFYYQAQAAFMVIKILNNPFKWLLVFNILPKFLTNFIYAIIAKTRYKFFGKYTSCPIPPPAFKDRFLD